MKNLVLATAMAIVGGAASAGGLSDPVVTPLIIETDAAASSVGGETFVILTALVILGTAAAAR